MSKIKISVVSYLNAKPFIFGLKNSKKNHLFSFSEDNPALCAKKLINNEVQLGLVPVAVIPEIPEHFIVSDYCISANGKVNSVFLFSNSAIENIKKIYLDPQSRSSNNLLKILCQKYWNVSIQYLNRETDFISIAADEAFVLIGDRTFGNINKYKFSYDLSEEWLKFTGLPFVFAAWVSNMKLSTEFISDFNEALKFGLENREKICDEYHRDDYDVKDYLMNKINYVFDDTKSKAINLYLNYCKELV